MGLSPFQGKKFRGEKGIKTKGRTTTLSEERPDGERGSFFHLHSERKNGCAYKDYQAAVGERHHI